jgi:hypothetical protein
MPMKRIRSILSGGEHPPASPIARKQKLGAPADPGSLAGIAVKREQSRQVDQRREERRSKLAERATLIVGSGEVDVSVINVSTGGIMVECDPLDLQIGETIAIRFADCDASKCDVRWMRGNRMGLEFREETTIVGSRAVQDFIIRKLRDESDPAADAAAVANRPVRQRLVWVGAIHYDNEGTPARVRNISAGGAMIECDWDFHIGTEVMLDLEEAGTVFATVRWCRGGQLGLRFTSGFDLRALARARPIRPRAARAEPPAADRPAPRGTAEAGKPPKPLVQPVRRSLSEIAELYSNGMTMR